MAKKKEPLAKVASKHGKFSAHQPQTEWCTEKGADRNMTLVQAFFFVDPDKKQWDVPAGYKIDGASIPQGAMGARGLALYRRIPTCVDPARQGLQRRSRR
jgi:Protein of unknown function (DUF1353)